MADEPTPPPTQIVPLIYSNTMQAAAGGIDISMDFGYRAPTGEVQMGVKVVMAWEHAALMHDLLGTLLERYREEVGEIRDITKVAEIRPHELGHGAGGRAE